MKRSLTLLLTLVVALWVSGLSAEAAGRGAKPAQTGTAHAASVANTKGVQHGLTKASAKQSVHKHAKKAKGKKAGKKAGKKLAKGTSKAKRH